MLLSVVYLRECRGQPIQDCVFGETKSRSVTKNWSGSGSGYGGGWKETKELDDITGFGWDVVVNNLSGSLRFELIVKWDCVSILLRGVIVNIEIEVWMEGRFLVGVGRKLCKIVCCVFTVGMWIYFPYNESVKSFNLICLR